MAAQGPWWPPANPGASASPTPPTENAKEPDLQAWYILPHLYLLGAYSIDVILIC